MMCVEHDHELARTWATSLIGQHRDYLGIEAKWNICLGILCVDSWEHPDPMPDGLISWIPDTYEAELCIRCDLPYGLLRRKVIHELIELSWYRTGTLYDQVSDELGSLFIKQYRVARNQEVELLVDLYLGEHHTLTSVTTRALWQQRRRRWRP